MSRLLVILLSAGVLASVALGGYNLYQGQERATEIQNLTNEVRDLKSQFAKQLKSPQPSAVQPKDQAKKK